MNWWLPSLRWRPHAIGCVWSTNRACHTLPPPPTALPPPHPPLHAPLALSSIPCKCSPGLPLLPPCRVPFLSCSPPTPPRLHPPRPPSLHLLSHFPAPMPPPPPPPSPLLAPPPLPSISSPASPHPRSSFSACSSCPPLRYVRRMPWVVHVGGSAGRSCSGDVRGCVRGGLLARWYERACGRVAVAVVVAVGRRYTWGCHTCTVPCHALHWLAFPCMCVALACNYLHVFDIHEFFARYVPFAVPSQCDPYRAGVLSSLPFRPRLPGSPPRDFTPPGALSLLPLVFLCTHQVCAEYAVSGACGWMSRTQLLW